MSLVQNGFIDYQKIMCNFSMNYSFIIEGEKLYVEQILVYHNEIPIFFICCNENKTKRFLALCTNIEKDDYIIVYIDSNTIIDMLKKRITMRDVFYKQQYCWQIFTAENIEDDVIIKIKSNELQDNVLPVKGAFFELSCPEHEKYLLKLEKIII